MTPRPTLTLQNQFIRTASSEQNLQGLTINQAIRTVWIELLAAKYSLNCLKLVSRSSKGWLFGWLVDKFDNKADHKRTASDSRSLVRMTSVFIASKDECKGNPLNHHYCNSST